MLFEHRSFWLPKDLEDRQGYQDAFEVDAQHGLASIADGVGSSLFSGSWAELLARSVVRETPDIVNAQSFGPWLERLRTAWRQPIDPEALAWHQKPKLAQGAHSTLLWVRLDTDAESERRKDVQLSCFAIGDCCLFHVRDKQVLRAFPFEQSELFTSTPATIASVAGPADEAMRFHTLTDRCLDGDLLVLSTDAFAVWALRRLEEGDSLDWESFWDYSPREFEEHICRWRQENAIRFDDTTIVLLRIHAEAPRAPAAGETLDHLIDDVKGSLGQVSDNVKSSLDDVTDNVRSSVDDVKEKVRRSVKRLRKWRTGGDS